MCVIRYLLDADGSHALIDKLLCILYKRCQVFGLVHLRSLLLLNLNRLVLNRLLDSLVQSVWTLHVIWLILLYIMEHWHLRIIIRKVLVLIKVDATSTGLELLSSNTLLMRINSTKCICVIVFWSIAIAQLSRHL